MINPVEDIKRNRPKTFDFVSELLPYMRQKAQSATQRIGDFASEVRDSVSPLGGKFKITQKFGNYNPSLYSGITKGARHLGLDVGTPEGTDVFAPKAGNVTYGNDRNWGKYADLNLPDGTVVRFSHLSETGSGGDVKPGQPIAKTGNTGNSTGAHLDISVRRGNQYIDPLTLDWLSKYLAGQGGGNNNQGGEGGMFPNAVWKKPKEEQRKIWEDFFTGAVMGATTTPVSGNPIMAKSSQLVSHEGAPDLQRVNHYLNKILKGEKIEPLKIIREGSKYGIEDGKHRFAAFQALGIDDIPVVLTKARRYLQDKATGKMMGSKPGR